MVRSMFKINTQDYSDKLDIHYHWYGNVLLLAGEDILGY